MSTEKKNEKKEDFLTLEQGVDYEIEKGLLVFTRSFLERRGYCCGNACRNCPYDHINVDKK